MNCAADIRHLSVAFGRHHVLHDINASFQERSISVLVGRSGSGKTTLLRAFNRLNEEFPGCRTSGQIYLNENGGQLAVYPEDAAGRRTATPGARARPVPLQALRLCTGMLFQTPNLFPVSVYRNLSMPLQLVGLCPKSELSDRVHAALKAVGLEKELENRLDMPAERLSGGQQQRLCLARTLALRPRILLLDEPTASLDVHAARGIEELIGEMAGRYTVIMVSHSLAQAKRMGERIFVCEDGGISQTLQSGEDISEALLEKLL